MKRRILDFGPLAGIVALYILLVSQTIGKWSIWFDEAFSAYLIRFNPVEIIKYTAADMHPPLYYLLLKGWSLIFGTSDVALRSMSATMIALAIVVMYLFIQRYFGRRAAIIAGLLMAAAPLLTRYGQEMRMYGLVALITTTATWVLYSATLASKRWKWIVYGVLVALGLWTHYFTVVVWAAHWVWRAVLVGKIRGSWRTWLRRYFTKSWLGAYLMAFVLFMPWIPAVYQQFKGVQTGGFWIPSVSALTPVNYLTTGVLFYDHADVKEWLALLFYGLIVLSTVAMIRVLRLVKGHERALVTLFVAVAFVPVVTLFILSLPPLKSSFIERYLLTSFVFLPALLGIVIAFLIRMKQWVFAGVLGSMLIASSVIATISVNRVGNFNRSTWETMTTKQVMQEIARVDSDQTPILIASPWQFYEAIQYDTPKHPVYFPNSNSPYGSYNMLRDSNYRKVESAEAFGKSMREFWYVGIFRDDTVHMPAGNWRVEKVITGDRLYPNSGTTHAYKLAEN